MGEGDYYIFMNRWDSELYIPKEGGVYSDGVDFPIKEISLEALEREGTRRDAGSYKLPVAIEPARS